MAAAVYVVIKRPSTCFDERQKCPRRCVRIKEINYTNVEMCWNLHDILEIKLLVLRSDSKERNYFRHGLSGAGAKMAK